MGHFQELGSFAQFVELLSVANNNAEVYLTDPTVRANETGSKYLLFTFWVAGEYQSKQFVHCGPTTNAGEDAKELSFCEACNSDGELFPVAYHKGSNGPKGERVF